MSLDMFIELTRRVCPHLIVRPPVKRLVLTTMLFVVQSQAHGAGLDRCPLLPKDSQLRWHFAHERHLEFDVCYATERGSDVQVFGFYFYEHPPEFIDEPEPIGPGTVAGHEVTWFGPGSNFNVGPLSRHATIAPGGRSRGFVLVYLYADNQTQLQSRLKTLRKIKMR